jgi:hypothetical protein
MPTGRDDVRFRGKTGSRRPTAKMTRLTQMYGPAVRQAWSFGGWVKNFLGEPETAIERFARAMRLSPLDSFVAGMRGGTAYAHFLLSRYDEAASWAGMATISDTAGADALKRVYFRTKVQLVALD